MRRWIQRAGLVVVLIIIGAIVLDRLNLGGRHDPSAESVAAMTNATICAATDYAIKNRLDGSSDRIYDCMIDGDDRCVTVDAGIANDSTAIAQLVFGNTLSGGKPTCAIT